jgi:fatty-acyl-CoA synthase
MSAGGSVRERLERSATAGHGVRFVGHSVIPTEGEAFVSWEQVHDEARQIGAVLQAWGIESGHHVALLGPTSRGLITAIRGCWLIGAASMVLPLPMRMASLDAFVEGTRARIHHGEARLTIIDDQLADFYQAAPGDPPTMLLSELLARAQNMSGDRLEIPGDDPDRLVILQYTSGSTSEPKGVMLPERVLLANVDACCQAALLGPGEVMVSWLPLYHDMGLVGFLSVPMLTGVDLVQAGPQDFMAHPGQWMQWISDWKGTATAGPNFAWVLATRALKRMSNIDLSSLTLALSGAEPVDPAAVEAFVEAAAPFGFVAGSIFPAFGMAEVGIGGAFPPRHRGLRCDTVDRLALEQEKVAKPIDTDIGPSDQSLLGVSRADEMSIRRLPLLGRAVPGLEMKVVDLETRETLVERHVGELLLRGTSVTPGYFKRPEATRDMFHEGWLCTGDLAYITDEELVICGRIKDVIIVGGRNIFPEDIERAVGGLDGVRAGNVIAFGVEGYKGKETVVIVAEVKSEDLIGIRQSIHLAALEVSGLPPRDIMLVRPGTVPKTSSGKLQRARCREIYLSGELDTVPGSER